MLDICYIYEFTVTGFLRVACPVTSVLAEIGDLVETELKQTKINFISLIRKVRLNFFDRRLNFLLNRARSIYNL
jgi:hypothetical protein